MKQRTEEERKRIIRECVKIEKAGGDVLAYLAGEHYVTPAATWHNIQRFDLHRKIFSDGRPRENVAGRKARYSNEELADRILDDRASPEEVLRKLGYTNAKQKLKQLMEWAMENYQVFCDEIKAREAEDNMEKVEETNVTPGNELGNELKIKAIEGRFGQWIWNDTLGTISFTPDPTALKDLNQEEELTPEQWIELAKEAPQVIAIMATNRPQP